MKKPEVFKGHASKVKVDNKARIFKLGVDVLHDVDT